MTKCSCGNNGKWVEITQCYLCDKCNEELASSFESAMLRNRDEDNYTIFEFMNKEEQIFYKNIYGKVSISFDGKILGIINGRELNKKDILDSMKEMSLQFSNWKDQHQHEIDIQESKTHTNEELYKIYLQENK